MSNTTGTKTSKEETFVVKPVTFIIGLAQVRMIENRINVLNNYRIELTDSTANVSQITKQLREKSNVADPIVMNCLFEKIENERANRGEVFWNRRNKFYFTSREEYESIKDRPFKRITYSIEPDKRPKTAPTFFPVTLPRTFRRSFTRIKISKGHILVYKHFPFELTEYTANVDEIYRIMREIYGLQDPIVLDMRYKEVKDSPRTRGEIFWNTNKLFYFLERPEWEEHSSKLQHKTINHITYFDNRRFTYYKSQEF